MITFSTADVKARAAWKPTTVFRFPVIVPVSQASAPNITL